MKSILDRSFRYTNSLDTDLAKTFARVRRVQRAAAKAAATTANAQSADASSKVVSLTKKAAQG